jgi:phage terminase large subunit-like protein
VAEPVCGFEFDGGRCRKRGDHQCWNRVRHVQAFFAECLVHTKGPWAGQPFTPAPWQTVRIIEPLFGQVRWDDFHNRYVRQYRVLYLLVARKNGKSELLAGMCLYLLIADGEQGAEIYGLALDMSQAGLVWNVARQMVRRNAFLKERLEVHASSGRIVDEQTASFMVTFASDAGGALGLNPSAAYIDELLTQPDRELFDAIRTGFGTRAQPLLLLATTAESDSTGFAASERQWSERVAADPDLDPERLVVIYTAPTEADWTDPKTWQLANPALGDFLELRTLASECKVAQANPVAERSFRQYRLNQPVSATGRAINIPQWDASAGELSPAELAEAHQGERCYGGLDLAATSDLAAYALCFQAAEGAFELLWRHFIPAAAMVDLVKRTGGQAALWVSNGFLTVTEGNVLDYKAIKAALERDAERFDIREVAFDRWGAVQLSTELIDDGWNMIAFSQGFGMMSGATAELLRLVGLGQFHHGQDPVARWEAGNVVARSDQYGNVKFDKAKSAEKIDGLVASVMALDRAVRHSGPERRYAAASF